MLGILKLEPPELWLSMCKEAVESLWVRIRRRITRGGVVSAVSVVGACYRLPDREEALAEAFLVQVED